MNDQPKRGKRVQIYLPADLLERWEQTPRYERSAVVANALRAWWEKKAPAVKGSGGVQVGTGYTGGDTDS